MLVINHITISPSRSNVQCFLGHFMLVMKLQVAEFLLENV